MFDWLKNSKFKSVRVAMCTSALNFYLVEGWHRNAYAVTLNKHMARPGTKSTVGLHLEFTKKLRHGEDSMQV